MSASSPAPGLPLPLRAVVPRALLVHATMPGLVRLAAVEWAWMGACWLAMARWPLLTPLAVLVVAGRLHALGVIFHDAVHLNVRRKGWGLRLLELLAGYPVASTWESTRYHHLRHHRDAGLPADPYRRRPHQGWRLGLTWVLMLGILPFWMLRGVVGTVAWALPSLRGPYARVFLQGRTGAVDADEVRACAASEPGQVLFHLGVLLLALRWPGAVLWGYLLPLLVAAGLNARRLLAEHTPAQARGRTLADVLAVTSDHGLGWPGRLLLAPRNVGCHVVHHLHPQVSLEHLPRLREWYLARFPHHYPRPGRP